jgi:hypothetical protein
MSFKQFVNFISLEGILPTIKREFYSKNFTVLILQLDSI